MARGRAPQLTVEELARIRRERSEATRAIRQATERAVTLQARAWLVEQGAIVPGEPVREELRRLDHYRRQLVDASARAYRPTARQQQAAPIAGIDVEIEF